MTIASVIKGTIALLSTPIFLLSLSAKADSESLHFRLNASAEIEAVVVGLLTNECGFRFLPATSITIVGGSISIDSPNVAPPPCFMPIVPPRPYEVIANLGVLPASSYSVTWTQGPSVLSAPLIPARLSATAVPVPIFGPFGLLLTAIFVGLFGAYAVPNPSVNRTLRIKPRKSGYL